MIFIFPQFRAIWGDIAFSDTISGEQIDHDSCGEPQNSQGKFQGKIYNNQTQQTYIHRYILMITIRISEPHHPIYDIYGECSW